MDDIQMKRIVCAVDFSEYSDYALGYAVDLARMFEADLTLLHVVELPFMPSYAMAGLPELSMPTEQIEQSARDKMEEIRQKCLEKHDKVASEVRIGTPFVEIIQCCRDLDADLVVVGTHGHTGLKHVIIGSVAEKVVRKAPCPVLSVKHPAHKFEMP